jgi:hypothetical protein
LSTYRNLAERVDTERRTWRQPFAVAVIALLALFARMPDRVIYGFLWGEDGPVFLQQAYVIGLRSIVTPYAGYLIVIPRFIAFSFSLLSDPTRSARPFMWASALILCASCAYLFSFARSRMPEPAAWIFALAPILVPHQGEVWLNITNIQWVIAPLLLVLLWEMVYVGIGRTKLFVLILMTLTGPFGLLYSPMVIVFMVRTRRFSRGAMMYFAAVAVQFVCVLVSPPVNMAPGEPPHPLIDYLHFPWTRQFLHHLVLDYLMPVDWVNRLGNHWAVAAIACVLGLTLCVALAGRRLICAALAAIAVGFWAIGILRTRVWGFDLTWYGSGARYFFIPFVFMTWALLLSITTTRYPTVRFIGGFLLVMMAIDSISVFSIQPSPRSEVLYESGKPATLTIPPSAGWNIKLPVGRE